MPAARKSWFVRSGRNAQGPMSSAELQQMARFGVITPESDVSQSETGPWRPAQQVKGLVFRQPELPPLEKSSPFDSFADPLTPVAPRDDGILLEEEVSEKDAPEEPEPAVVFEAAPPPTLLPLAAPPWPKEQYPGYAALRATSWALLLFGILGSLGGLGVGVLGVMALNGSETVFQESASLSVIGGGAALFIAGITFIVIALLIPPCIDVARDARRQRIAAERSVILLDLLLERQSPKEPERQSPKESAEVPADQTPAPTAG